MAMVDKFDKYDKYIIDWYKNGCNNKISLSSENNYLIVRLLQKYEEKGDIDMMRFIICNHSEWYYRQIYESETKSAVSDIDVNLPCLKINDETNSYRRNDSDFF